ncbi:STAS domain-containing protein [Paractinoplanes hotanensis]|uniref:STAS domain-containing protein n=1 Tax=Paractinoplanes hotanensis TaxID=2906497 RepID=UPI0034DB3DEB
MSELPTLELVADVLRYCPGDVVVDVSGLTFIDVGGLRVFARAASALRSDGRRLLFAGCPLPIRRIIEVLGWTSLLQAVEEVAGDGHQQGDDDQRRHRTCPSRGRPEASRRGRRPGRRAAGCSARARRGGRASRRRPGRRRRAFIRRNTARTAS